MSGPERWFLLRGLGRESGHWGDFPRVLGERLPGAECIGLDFPGTGLPRGVQSPATLSGIVDFLQRASEPFRDSGPGFLVGVSMGGMVAIEWLLRHPKDFRGAVLINTSLGGMSPARQRLLPGAMWRMLLARLNRSTQEERILELVSNVPERRQAALPDWVRVQATRPTSTTTALRQLVAAARYKAPAEPPPHPVLLLSSAQDRVVDPSCSDKIHQAWGWPLKVHPEGGHELSLDAPEWVAEEIARWRASLPGE